MTAHRFSSPDSQIRRADGRASLVQRRTQIIRDRGLGEQAAPSARTGRLPLVGDLKVAGSGFNADDVVA